MKHSLEDIEIQLKKRWDYRYVWRRKQNNLWDSYTPYIYNTLEWETLIPHIAHTANTYKLDKHEIFYYAINRWYNFWSAQAVEAVFAQLPQVTSAQNKKDKHKDFFIDGIPFDHKTSVFPKGFQASFTYATQHKRELITWLYQHQSSQSRYHTKNRIFIITHHPSGAHWKLKAEIQLLQTSIEKYMKHFSPKQLEQFTFANNTNTLSDIIWVTK